MTYVYESKNDDPNGCPDTVIGECEAVCARCGRDMHNELLQLRQVAAAARVLLDAVESPDRAIYLNECSVLSHELDILDQP